MWKGISTYDRWSGNEGRRHIQYYTRMGTTISDDTNKSESLYQLASTTGGDENRRKRLNGIMDVVMNDDGMGLDQRKMLCLLLGQTSGRAIQIIVKHDSKNVPWTGFPPLRPTPCLALGWLSLQLSSDGDVDVLGREDNMRYFDMHFLVFKSLIWFNGWFQWY